MKKDPYIVSEEAYIIILNSNSDVCMSNNGKDTKHTRHISRRMHLVRNGENFKMHNIDWCERDLQMADIYTKHFGEHD